MWSETIPSNTTIFELLFHFPPHLKFGKLPITLGLRVLLKEHGTLAIKISISPLGQSLKENCSGLTRNRKIILMRMSQQT